MEAVRRASPLLAQVTPLLERVAPYVSPVVAKIEFARFSDQRIRRPLAQPRTVARVERRAILPTMRSAMAGDLAGPTDFLERLGWYREMLDDTLAASVPTWEPQRHLYGLVKDFIDRSGKGLRPALCIATTRALGGRAEDALPSAAGIEMLHNAFLVHDDIEDGSDSRRGVATMHRRVGVPIAVNTGDAMNALAMRFSAGASNGSGPAAALRILDEVDHMLVESLEGQAVELGWVRDNDLTVRPDDYLRLVLKKTAWYSFIHPMRIGALVANGDDQNLDRFDRFGFLLGAGVPDHRRCSQPHRRRRPVRQGDRWRSMGGKADDRVGARARQRQRDDRAWIGKLSGRPRERRLTREVLQLRQILAHSTGSIEWAQQSAVAFAEAAKREFDETAFAGVPAGPDLEWLRKCVDFIVQRNA